MRKRGQLVLITLIGIVIAAIVALTYPYVAKSLASGKTALKISAARDIALVVDTIYAYPYDMKLEYDIDLSEFIVEISENSVKIHDASSVRVGEDKKLKGKDSSFAQYAFVPVNENPNFILDKPKKLIFKKQDEKLTITAENENI